MAITALPTPPSRSDPANFADRGDAFLGALPTFQSEANALAVDVTNKQGIATTQAGIATTQAGIATAQAVLAEAAKNAAIAVSGAVEWVSGTTYAVGFVVWSPITYLSYRRTTAGAGTTDPSLDGANWAQLGATGDVTLDGTQTLTNKTIDIASNTLTGVAGLTATQTLTNKTVTDLVFDGKYTEEVFTITDGASVDIDPANGTVQVWTLGESRSPTATNFASGQSVTLLIDDGTAYAITWPSTTWKTDGGEAPTLNTDSVTVIQLWKVSTVLYGARVGDA